MHADGILVQARDTKQKPPIPTVVEDVIKHDDDGDVDDNDERTGQEQTYDDGNSLSDVSSRDGPVSGSQSMIRRNSGIA